MMDFIYISMLFTGLLYGSVPHFFLSTNIPIPKTKLKAMSDSDNYRSNALSSVMGKYSTIYAAIKQTEGIQGQ